jgi:hypothetical protein
MRDLVDAYRLVAIGTGVWKGNKDVDVYGLELAG